MTTIQLQIPDEMDAMLASVSSDRKSFILEAVQDKLRLARKRKLNTLLAEGYKATSQEDLEISKDFEQADFENWK